MSFSNTLIKVPIIILGCHAILNLFRGSMHFFLPEGGSIAIAGLDIGNGDQRQIIISIFATLGEYKGNSLSKPSPYETFLTVKEELTPAFFFAIQTPSKACVLSLFFSIILT